MKNRKIYLLLLCVFILNFNFSFKNISASETFSTEWVRKWSGGGNRDRATALLIDSLGNIFLAGISEYIETPETNWAFINLVKYDSSGLEQWNRTWNANQFDFCNGIALDSSGNIYLGGDTIRMADLADMILIKYDSSGVQQWNRTWGGEEIDYCLAIAVDSLNNIYLAGYTSSFGAGGGDISLVKYNSTGGFQWARTWGGSGHEFCSEIALDSYNNIYIIGGTSSFGSEDKDFCLLKYDSSGVLLWNKTWGGAEYDIGKDILIDFLNNIYITGETGNFLEDHVEIYLAKLDNSGILQWNLTFGGTGNDRSYAIAMDSSNDLFFLGRHSNFGTILYKYNSSGFLQLNQTWSEGFSFTCYAIALDSSDNIYLAGFSGDDMCLGKLEGKVSETVEETETISGYNLFILISTISVVSVILFKKRQNIQLKN